jgi:hypothetical protein
MAIDSMLVILASLGEVAVLILLLMRGIPRKLPWFFAYVAWSVLSDIALYIAARQLAQVAFYRVYTGEMVIDSALQFAVLTELIWSVLRPVRKSLPKSSLWILIGIVGLAGVVIWPLAGQTVPPELTSFARTVFHLSQTIAILRVLLFVVMAAFSQVLSIGWRDRELQVATGLGFYSIVSLLVAVLHTHQLVGAQYHWLDRVVSVSYLCTLSYWVLNFARKDEKRKEFSDQMRGILVSIGVSLRTDGIPIGNPPDSEARRRKR